MKSPMHWRYFSEHQLQQTCTPILYSARAKVSTIQPALLEFRLMLQTPLRGLIAPQNEFLGAPVMELVTTVPSSKSGSWSNLCSPQLTALTVESTDTSGTVFDLNMASNLFITARPALSIIFNANNIQVKSPLRGALWRLTTGLFYYSSLHGADLCLVLYKQVLRIFRSRNLYLRLPLCKNQLLKAFSWLRSQRKGLEA